MNIHAYHYSVFCLFYITYSLSKLLLLPKCFSSLSPFVSSLSSSYCSSSFFKSPSSEYKEFSLLFSFSDSRSKSIDLITSHLLYRLSDFYSEPYRVSSWFRFI